MSRQSENLYGRILHEALRELLSSASDQRTFEDMSLSVVIYRHIARQEHPSEDWLQQESTIVYAFHCLSCAAERSLMHLSPDLTWEPAKALLKRSELRHWYFSLTLTLASHYRNLTGNLHHKGKARMRCTSHCKRAANYQGSYWGVCSTDFWSLYRSSCFVIYAQWLWQIPASQFLPAWFHLLLAHQTIQCQPLSLSWSLQEWPR